MCRYPAARDLRCEEVGITLGGGGGEGCLNPWEVAVVVGGLSHVVYRVLCVRKGRWTGVEGGGRGDECVVRYMYYCVVCSVVGSLYRVSCIVPVQMDRGGLFGVTVTMGYACLHLCAATM